ncbi:hypothetical protein ABBQ32_006602 [Trebouxia sp. C0010 RCD-2024]
MGSAITKEADEETPVSRVQVSEGLVQQLDGRSSRDPHTRPFTRGGPSWLPHIRPSGPSPGSDFGNTATGPGSSPSTTPPNASQNRAQHDNSAQSLHPETEHMHQQAHPRETKAEAASQQKVNEYADQLVKEYEVPLKAFPCQDEKTECLLCYQSNQQDPLRCAAQVDAFTKCARKASAIMVK